MSDEQITATPSRVTVLATKLHIPQPRPGVVARQRLLARLAEGLARPLILISAPAGFGKTTLVGGWIAQTHGLPAAWLSLEDDDNDPARFLAYLISALDTLKPGLGAQALGLLALPQVPPWKTIITTLLNSLAAVQRDFILVLDDYHVLTEPVIHDALAYLLEHAPANMHLVILSRADPALPLARLRARGQVLELREADLRFTAPETTAFLSQTMQLALTAADVTALQRQTEGWIVGLQMAALCLAEPGMQEQGRPAGFIAAFGGSNRFILDYLMEEVLARQPENVQRFLLQTAILDQLCGPLCAAVLGIAQERPGAQAILENLERANLFTIPLDHERRWYRYHRLFADFLRGRLLSTRPDLIPELHRRAAHWYEAQGLADEAIGHALDGADWEHAASLSEGRVQDLILHGQVVTVLGWLEALPAEILHLRPKLSVFYAFTLLITGQYARVEEYLTAAEHAGADAAGQAGLQAQITAARVMISFYTGADFTQNLELALKVARDLPQDQPLARSISALVTGLTAFMRGDLTTAHQALDESMAISQAAGGHPLIGQLAVYTAGYEQMMRGNLGRAAGIFENGLRLLQVGPGSDPPPIACLVYQAMGELLRERNDLAAAEHYLVEAAALGERVRSPDILADGVFALARLWQARGDPVAGLAVLDRVVQQAHEGRITALTTRQALAHRARLLIAQGDLPAAERWAAGLEAARQSTQTWQWSGTVVLVIDDLENTVLARLWLAQHRYGPVADLMADVLQGARSSEWTSVTLEALALRALALEGQGDHAGALAALRASLLLAEPEGYARIYLDEGAPMALLLQRLRAEGSRAQVEGPLAAYIDRLLGVFPQPGGPESSSWQGSFAPYRSGRSELLIEPLSAREREVLALVAAGLSTGEIADRLVISAGTVKRHINNIHEKLNVHSRVQAIARARELHLL